VLWSITTQDNPAHPTAVKRAVVKRDGAVYIDMRVKCGASKSTCDAIVQQFQALNAQLSEEMKKRKSR
jgi:hypothetical protein